MTSRRQIVTGALAAAASLATPRAARPQAREQVLMIKDDSPLAPALETTVVVPDGAGPVPVVVVNHGQSGSSLPAQQRRYAPPAAIELFARLGCAVVLPMRRGFSRSQGRAVGFGGTCSLQQFGDQAARDLHAVVAWIEQQPWADTQRMMMLGQSAGGLATLAYAASAPHPGLRLFASLAGGVIDTTGVCDWRSALLSAMQTYGSRTRTPSLWFYGSNDSYFSPAVFRAMHAAYIAGGAPAQLVELGPIGEDSHRLLTSREAQRAWWPVLLAKMAGVGLGPASGRR